MSLPNELRGNGRLWRGYEKVFRTAFLLRFVVETSRRMFRCADVHGLEYSRIVDFVVRQVPEMSMVTRVVVRGMGSMMGGVGSVVRGRMTRRLVVRRWLMLRLGS